MLGLPDGVRACLFDLDGVLTETAKVHAAAWKQMFDEYLRQRTGEKQPPFDESSDYGEYVDGKPRNDGVRSFFASRGIELSDNEVIALGNRVSAGLPAGFILVSGAVLVQILLNVPLTITLLSHGAGKRRRVQRFEA